MDPLWIPVSNSLRETLLKLITAPTFQVWLAATWPTFSSAIRGGAAAAAPHFIWEFPKKGVPYLGGPYNKDPTIEGTIFGSPIFGNSHIEA